MGPARGDGRTYSSTWGTLAEYITKSASISEDLERLGSALASAVHGRGRTGEGRRCVQTVSIVERDFELSTHTESEWCTKESSGRDAIAPTGDQLRV